MRYWLGITSSLKIINAMLLLALLFLLRFSIDRIA